MSQKVFSIALLAFAAGLPLNAQELDYQALEQLFGEPITTSVTGSPQRISDVPASMTIIGADEIRRSGARDLPGVLRHVMSVDVMQTTNDHADVAIRGYDQAFSPRLLVLVDGRQVYADYYGFTPWATIPVELAAIRQIEIVRGPNSALYGFNAVGGVINIVTYDPGERPGTSASLLTGTQNLVQASAVSSVKLGDGAGFRLSAGHRTSDDFATPQPAADLGTRRGDVRNELNLAGDTRLGDKIIGYFEGTASAADHSELGPVYDGGFTEYDTSSLKARIAADTQLGLIEGTIYRNDIRARIYQGAQPTPFLDLDNDVIVSRLQSVSKIGATHTLRLSAEHRTNNLNTSPLEGAEIFYDVNALAAMWQWRPLAAVALTAAARVDRLELGRRGLEWPGYPLRNSDWDRGHTARSFNVGVVWRMSDDDTLRFGVARGVQLPKSFDLGGFVLPVPPVGYVTGVPTLEPTSVDNLEVGWSHEVAALGAKLEITAFNGRTERIVASVGGADFLHGIVGMPANIGASVATGVELALHADRDEGWRWGVSYTPLHIDDRFDGGRTVATTLVDFEHTTPRQVLNGNVGWRRGPWEVDAYLRHEAGLDGIAADSTTAPVVGKLVPLADFTTVDARLGYRLTDRIDLALSGQGLTHAQQRQTAAPAVERRIFGTLQIAF